MGILPKTKSIKKNDNPKNLIIFGLPKVGKTSALAQLPNALLIDLENGAEYQDCYKLTAQTYMDLYKIAKALKEEEHNFQFVILDTVTALEDICLPLANKLYRDTPMGKNFGENDNVLKLPNGAGFLYQREAMQMIIGWFEKVVPNVILVGHVKDKALNEGGTELALKDLDLTGKTARILSAKSDAICYVYRDAETHNLMANFGGLNEVLCGARMPHLAGKTILLAERKEKDNGDFEIITHWDNIYPSLKNE